MNNHDSRHRFSMQCRIFSVFAIFILICAVALFLTLVSLQVMSSVRAYVAGEGMWSKGESEAVYQLQLYGRTRNPMHLRKFEEALATPLGYREARHELLQADFDEERVRAALLRGQTNPEDIPGIIRLFRCCSHLFMFQQAFQAWAIGDEFILQLADIGEALRREIESPGTSDARIDALLREADALKERVQPFASEFTATLGKSARAIVAILFLFTVGVVALLVSIGSYVSWQILQKLRQSEAQYRSLFNTANDAIFVVDPVQGKILEVNPRAEKLTGKKGAELSQTQYGELFPAPEGEDRTGNRIDTSQHAIYTDGNRQATMHCDGRDIAVDIVGSTAAWQNQQAYFAIVRDITEWRRREEQLRIAANAMENMVEGVVITDARWRIVSVNRAFTHITGYASHEVIGKPMPYSHARNGDKAFYRSIFRTVMKADKWQGEISHQKMDGTVYTAQMSISAVRTEHGVITHYIFVFADISASKEYEQRLHHLAHYDPLTNLPNRAHFQMKLERAVQSAAENGTRLALLFIDLDGFKLINDTYGHAAGDYLLQEVARRIHACLRQDDFVARLAGDEFTVLLENLADTECASKLASKLLGKLSETITFGGKDITVFASIGFSLLPDDAADAQTLLVNADTAMYEAKHQGRNNYQMFRPWMTADVSSRLQLASSLKYAIDRNELELHYQPCVSMESRQIASLEVLLRWNHPQLGTVSPSVFIPLAEEVGLIGGITDWVLRTACRQGTRWMEMGYPPVQLDVNISPCNFWDARLPETIRKVLDETRWQAEWLCLEITETAMANQEKSKAMLTELNAMGMRLAIDDFGIGYSSLSYLKDFPVHYLKIDRSFTISSIASASNASITRAIIAVAKGLNLRVIAEGVETEAQEAFLRSEGCDQLQGYFFAKPMPARQMEPILAEMSRIDQI